MVCAYIYIKKKKLMMIFLFGPPRSYYWLCPCSGFTQDWNSEWTHIHISGIKSK